MAQRWVPAGMLAGALALIAALYLPWQETACRRPDDFFRGSPTAGLESLGLGGCPSVDGWATGVGSPTALAAVVLAALSIACLIRGATADVGLGQCALTAGYFAVAVAVRASTATRPEARILDVHYHYAYGAFLGIVSAAVVVLLACATPLRQLVTRRPANVVTLLLGAALLVALLLPWSRFGGVTTQGVVLPAGAIAAGLTSLVVAAFWRPDLWAFGAAVLVVVGGAVSSLTFPLDPAYGAWLALAIAAAFAVLAAAVSRIASLRVPTRALPTTVLGALLVATLFLPWQRTCFAPGDAVFGGRCVSTNGWGFTVGPVVAALVVLIVVAPASIELSAALALFVATMGFGLMRGSELGERFSFGYGSIAAFVVAGALVAVVLSRVQLPPLRRSRIVDTAAPLLACASYIALVALPWWDVLPEEADRALRFGPLSWLTMAGALLAIGLAGRWLRRVGADAPSDPLLVSLPLVLLALASLDLVRGRERGISWGGGIAVVLCLALAALGRTEQHGGLRFS